MLTLKYGKSRKFDWHKNWSLLSLLSFGISVIVSSLLELLDEIRRQNFVVANLFFYISRITLKYGGDDISRLFLTLLQMVSSHFCFMERFFGLHCVLFFAVDYWCKKHSKDNLNNVGCSKCQL